MNKKHLTILFLLFVFLFAYLSTNNVFIKSQSKNSEIGKYQISTCYRESGNWVFITIIDTQTGEILRQERFNGFDNYKEK